jgi:GNAT superfamily N-acetyltransferase
METGHFNSMKIRFAQEKDIERINELLVQIGGIHHKARPDIFNPATPKFNRDELLGILDSANKFIFVAVDDNDVVQGHLFCHIRESDGQGVVAKIKTMWIEDLCVDENIRSKGIGSQLFDVVEKFAKEQQCDSITLNVWQFNEGAKVFYEKKGMSIQRTTLEKNI